MRLFAVFLSAFVFWIVPASAQPQAGVPARALSDAAEVSLLTILPGDDVPSMYGHTAIRVRDPALGIDWAYNYGTYDFSDPFFIPKFVYGRLLYFLDVSPYEAMAQRYRHFNRPIIEQALRLTPAQKDALFRRLQINARPENRVYEYDFFFDNCSTRPRDIIAEVLEGRLRFRADDAPQQSFRRLIDPYAADKPALDLGMDLLLGLPSDAIATSWQEMFLPEHLKAAFDRAEVRTADGTWQPLVVRTDTTRWATPYVPAQAAWPWPTLFGWLLLAGAAGATWRQHQSGHVGGGRLPDAVLLFAAGMAGLLVAFMMTLAQHAVTEYNLHLLWLWPTHLWAAYAVARGREGRALRLYLAAAAGLTLLLAAGWFLWPQDLHAAALPLALLVALRCGWRAYALDARLHKQRAPAMQRVPS